MAYTNPQGAALSQALTDYALSIQADFAAVMSQADWMSPVVVTGARNGTYAIFDTKQAFLSYDTQRAIGGPRRRIKHAGGTGTYANKPQGLETTLDDSEVDTAASRPDQERAKTRTLMSNWANARFSRVWAKAVTSGNYTASTVTNSGKWSDPNIDPIQVLDKELVLFRNRTGRAPNKGIIALDNWVTLRNHPEVIKRQPGAANIGINLAQLSAMLALPVEFRIDDCYLGTTGFGSSTDVKAAKTIGYAMLFLAQNVASTDDPSWMKTTRRTSSGFNGIRSYRDESCNSDVFFLEEEEDVVCSSSLCGQLITIN